MTAAAANRLGLDCHLALAGQRAAPPRRQPAPRRPARRDAALHRRARLLRDRDVDRGARRAARGRRADARSRSRSAARRSPVSSRTRRDRRAARRRLRTIPDWIFVADGSGGTHAGLLAGLGASSATRVVGVDVGTRPDLDDVVPRLAAEAARDGGRDAPSTARHRRPRPLRRRLRRAHRRVRRTRSARVARAEGILLDPVYSGKAMAALLDVAARRPHRRRRHRRVLAHRRRARALRSTATRTRSHRQRVRDASDGPATAGPSRVCSVAALGGDLDQASRTLYATAAPMARTSRSRRSFFTGVALSIASE